MKKKFFNLIVIGLFILLPQTGFSQSPANLDIFLKLADSSANEVLTQVPDSIKSLGINMNFGSGYAIFKNRLLADFYRAGKSLIVDSSANNRPLIVNFAIEDASVNYDDVKRNGLFGDFYTIRNFRFKGNYVFEGNLNMVKNFNYSYKDSVSVDDIKNLENDAYPFTKSEIPAEPFLSNFYEPVIAVGAAAVAVFLFFAIRSK